MIARGFAAIAIGVYGAGLMNALVLMLVAGGLITSLAEVFVVIPLMAAFGAVLTAPAWIMFCLMFLPVVTHRVRIGRRLPRTIYFTTACVLGALLIVPVFALLAPVTAYIWLVPIMGAIGGGIIALVWTFLVLDVISLPHVFGASRA